MSGSGIDDTRRVITATFQSSWTTGAYAHTPVLYPGAVFTPPSTPFMVLSIVGGASRQAEITGENPYIRRTGFVQIDVSVPAESGTIDASKMLDVAVAIFEGKQLSYQNSGFMTFANATDPVWRTIQGRTIGTCRVDYRGRAPCSLIQIAPGSSTARRWTSGPDHPIRR
jgi:hypothetical protein